MTIKKAVITSAGPDHHFLPLQTLHLPGGHTKTVLSLLLDEAFASGIEEIAVIIAPGLQREFRSAITAHQLPQVSFIEQPQPLGFGHAVLMARPFTGPDPFLLMLGDHLYLSRGKESAVQQLLQAAKTHQSPVAAVQPTHESMLPYYGAVGGDRLPGFQGLYEIHTALEKPTPTVAEQQLIVPGLRAGNYLCFYGMHVLNAHVMDHLATSFAQSPDRLLLTPSLHYLAQQERFLACEIQTLRFNIGESYGLLRAQLGMGLAGADREEVMAHIIELLAATR